MQLAYLDSLEMQTVLQPDHSFTPSKPLQCIICVLQQLIYLTSLHVLCSVENIDVEVPAIVIHSISTETQCFHALSLDFQQVVVKVSQKETHDAGYNIYLKKKHFYLSKKSVQN